MVVDFDGFARLCTERSDIVIGDGVPRLAVTAIAQDEVRARVVSPGPISARKGVNVTYARPELPAITEKDLADLAIAVEADADFIALSFVRSAADMEQLKAHMDSLGSRARTIAKIEKIEAYENLDEILAVSDGVMVARGDYGVEAGVAPRAADAEGHDRPRHPRRQGRDHGDADARVDDPERRADPGGGGGHRQRGDRRYRRR